MAAVSQWRSTALQTTSKPCKLQFGVPQGLEMGPILYTMYVALIADIVGNHGLKDHICADDTNLHFWYGSDGKCSASLRGVFQKFVHGWSPLSVSRVTIRWSHCVTRNGFQTMTVSPLTTGGCCIQPASRSATWVLCLMMMIIIIILIIYSFATRKLNRYKQKEAIYIKELKVNCTGCLIAAEWVRDYIYNESCLVVSHCQRSST